MDGDIFVFETFKIKLFKVFIALHGWLQFGISEFIIKGIQTFCIQEMVNTLTTFTAEKKLFIVLLFSYHHLFGKGEVTVGTCYLSQVMIPCRMSS